MQNTTIKLGGKNGDLTCEKCGKLRWPKSLLCPDCWEKENPGRGTLNSKGTVLQQLLPKDVWQATNFAASLIDDSAGQLCWDVLTSGTKSGKVEGKESRRTPAVSSSEGGKRCR